MKKLLLSVAALASLAAAAPSMAQPFDGHGHRAPAEDTFRGRPPMEARFAPNIDFRIDRWT